MRSLKDKAYDALIILTLLNIMFISTHSQIELKAEDIITEAGTEAIDMVTEVDTEVKVEVDTEEEIETVEATEETTKVTEVIEYTPTIKEIQDTPDTGKALKNLKFNVQVKEYNDKIIKGYTETKTSYTGDIIIHLQDTTKINCKIKVGNTYLIEVEPTLKMSIPTEANAVKIKEKE